MTAFLVKRKCYYGEGQIKPRLMYAGDVYVSNTLDPKKAPPFLEVKKAAPTVVASKPAAAESELSYQEMKTFIADNKIEVADYKKPTMEKAIAAFKASDNPAADEAEEGGEAEEGEETEAELEADE